jgi:N,N'-diacetylbacillosaminyl-diphospho-undecaprenol alpha-1,3-N-acetylgalactosaminyltransferase
MKIVFICPDSSSLLLFCRGILAYLKGMPGIVKLDVIVGDDGADEYLKDNNIGSVVVPIYRFFSISKDTKTLIDLYKVFTRNKYDVVINFSTKPNILGTLAAFFAKTPRIYFHIVGLGSLNIDTSSLKVKALRFFLNSLYSICFKIADKVWFTNKHNVKYFKDHLSVDAKKIVLTRNYLDTNYYKPIDSDDIELQKLREELNIEDEKIVVMVARMIWSKGIKEFVESAKIIGIKHHNVRFVLVAPLESDSPDAVSDSFIQKMDEQNNLTWLQFREDVINFYGISDISVLPTFYQEGGYPRALLEPMSMGKPVITTNNPNTIGAVDHDYNGFIVQERNTPELADAIERIIFNEELLKEFGNNSRKKAVGEFDEKLIIKQAFKEMNVI